MRVILTRDSRIMHHAGEIVEVSPEVAAFLISVKSAEPEEAETPEKKKKKK